MDVYSSRLLLPYLPMAPLAVCVFHNSVTNVCLLLLPVALEGFITLADEKKTPSGAKRVRPNKCVQPSAAVNDVIRSDVIFCDGTFTSRFFLGV